MSAELTHRVGAPNENAADHIYALFAGEIGICGCGTPTDAYDLVRDILALYRDQQAVRHAHDETVRLTGSPGAAHLIMGMLDTRGLVEHGTTWRSGWLTPKGQWFLTALERVSDWSVLDDAGFPHGGAACTDACWRAPIRGGVPG